ncbi:MULTISPECIES: chorismate lyase [Prochlorococcus]|uniref:chorismate lyase n=1 Tax=Prochlorococcus TaxID=1218 RepID=UPI00145F2D19|nr:MULTISPECIES: chorismate lyase [Prochlorococcus]MEC7383028.1 chorismate lyase [Cyanobacteriota bacterium]MEC7738108.1 chorismate lyase [Cyanobacteriota bacterium]MEC9028403.1 chorismate lyase [Cyanobacteriota bacterium]MEC9453341.1 chorismate lyase [Cyanobacteriota bacterium]MED5165187.1 chorismate lyase [Cyanobacteriota bacterium]
MISPARVWDAPSKAVLSGEGPWQLPGPWRLMLLGDGSPTRHLRLLTGHEVQVNLIAMQPEPNPDATAPQEVRELKPPLLRRQVWLICDSHTLAWAESWWNFDEAEKHLHNRNQPIWDSLTKGRSELFREVDGLGLVAADWLESAFGQTGPFWSRHYRFFRQERELTVIREVFSPELEKWLGPTPRQELQLCS